MRACPLRGQQGLRPYARAKPFAASRLTGARYPKTRRNFESAAEVASFRSPDEVKNVAARATAEAVENFLSGVNVERRVPFGMEGAKPDVLPARAPELRVPRSDGEKIGAGLHLLRIEQARDHRRAFGAML